MKQTLIKNVLLFSAALLSSSLLMAETQLSEYEKWRQQELKSFQSYLDENDKSFIQFLKAQWQAVDVKPETIRDPAPKPDVFPTAPDVQPDLAEEPAPVIKPQPTPPPAPVKPLPTPKPQTTKPKPATPKPAVPKPDNTDTGLVTELESKNIHTAKFRFFGNPVTIQYAKSFKRNFSGKISGEKIADYWQYLATQEHQPTINQLLTTAQELNLNDWGTALLFDQFSGSILRQQTSRRLTSWFLLVKAGYDARVAYKNTDFNSNVFLLLPSKQDLYEVTFFTHNNTRYYALNFQGKPLQPGKVFTYYKQHGAGSSQLDFSQPNDFVVQGKAEKRAFSFNYGGQEYNLSVSYPSRYVDYFNSFPQLALPNYIQAGLPAATAESLLKQLQPVVAGQSEREAVNRLLRFVQTAFKYQTDQQQFKQENPLFPLETLHYPYSDCEDRAVLFAWLTHELLGLDVIILDYPGHVATAVHFNSKVNGDAWQYQGKRYVIADPTYPFASVGMTMPDFAGISPKVEPF